MQTNHFEPCWFDSGEYVLFEHTSRITGMVVNFDHEFSTQFQNPKNPWSYFEKVCDLT